MKPIRSNKGWKDTVRLIPLSRHGRNNSRNCREHTLCIRSFTARLSLLTQAKRLPESMGTGPPHLCCAMYHPSVPYLYTPTRRSLLKCWSSHTRGQQDLGAQKVAPCCPRAFTNNCRQIAIGSRSPAHQAHSSSTITTVQTRYRPFSTSASPAPTPVLSISNVIKNKIDSGELVYDQPQQRAAERLARLQLALDGYDNTAASNAVDEEAAAQEGIGKQPLTPMQKKVMIVCQAIAPPKMITAVVSPTHQVQQRNALWCLVECFFTVP